MVKKRNNQKKSPVSGRESQPYWNPYVAGVGLGLTLLAAFVFMGRGLGASGAFTSLVSWGVDALAPVHAAANGMFNQYLEAPGGHPLVDWLVIQILGVFVGGLISGLLASRIKPEVVRGPRATKSRRLLLAFSGGVLMGFAAKLARGCTSGQALTGGALLSVGSWIFMLAMFIGAYAFAYFVRRQWT